MDFRSNPEVRRLDDVPEAERPFGPTITMDSDKALSSTATGGQEMEGEYDGGRD